MAKWTQGWGVLMTDNDMFFAKQAAATQSIQYHVHSHTDIFLLLNYLIE